MTDELRIPPDRDLPPGRLERRRAHVVRELSLAAASSRRRRRRLALIAVPAAIVVLAASGFTTYVLTREPTQLDTIGCFETPDVDGSVAVVNADGRDPRAICAELWRDGALRGRPMPERFAACVLQTGAVGVFPSSEPGTCERLGLAELPASYAAAARRLAGLRDALVARFASECVGEQVALTVVRRALDARGLSAWDVAVTDGAAFGAERPCAAVAFDGKRREVVLAPVEPPEIACYARARLPATFVVVAADGRDPVAVCIAVWRERGLADARGPAVACLLHGSSVGVFPGRANTCRTLGPAVSPLRESH